MGAIRPVIRSVIRPVVRSVFGDEADPLAGAVIFDPYRDVQGRNIAPVSPYANNLTISGSSYKETTASAVHGLSCADVSVDTIMCITFIPVGRIRFLLGTTATSWAIFDTSLVSVVAKGANCPTASIVDNGDGGFTATAVVLTATAASTLFLTMPDTATDNTARTFVGDIAKGFNIVTRQQNFGSSLAPYSPILGVPQSLANYGAYGSAISAQNGSAAGADTNDAIFSGLTLIHTTNQYALTTATAFDMRNFSEFITGKFAGTSGVVWSLADSTTTTKYQAIKQAASGKLSIISRNGGAETESAQLDVSTTLNVCLHFSANNGTLTLTNMATGASVTLADTAPTTAPRIAFGAVGSSTVAQIVNSLQWSHSATFRQAKSNPAPAYRKIKSLLAGRGVTVA